MDSIKHSRQLEREGREAVDGVIERWLAAGQCGAIRRIYSIAAVFDYPVIHHGYPRLHTGYTQHDPVYDVPSFRKRLARRLPILEGFDLEAAGLVLAGGLVSCLITRETLYGESDADLFFVDHHVNALATLEKLAAHLEARALAVSVIRTQKTVSFVCEMADKNIASIPIQVILCRYADVGEVLYSFDIGSAAIAWNGSTLSLAEPAVFALRNNTNIVCLPLRGPGYEHRLMKYSARNFDLIMPDFRNDYRVPYDKVVSLKNLAFYTSSKGAHSECPCKLRIDAPVYVPKPSLGDSISANSQYSGPCWKSDPRLDSTRRVVNYILHGTQNLVSYNPYTEGCFRVPAPVGFDPTAANTIARTHYGGEIAGYVYLLGPVEAAALLTAMALAPTEDRKVSLAEGALKKRYGGQDLTIPLEVQTTENMETVWAAFPRTPMSPEEWYGEWFDKN